MLASAGRLVSDLARDSCSEMGRFSYAANKNCHPELRDRSRFAGEEAQRMDLLLDLFPELRVHAHIRPVLRFLDTLLAKCSIPV